MNDSDFIDTGNVQLPEQLHDLTERLAANVHHHWAGQRFADGWQYGPVHDDSKKQSPLLVPYAQLSEADKEYDRITAVQTVRAILALGFTIIPPS
jgi:hypothetical protein